MNQSITRLLYRPPANRTSVAVLTFFAQWVSWWVCRSAQVERAQRNFGGTGKLHGQRAPSGCRMAGQLDAPPGVDLSALMKMVAEAEAEGGVAQRDVEAALAATEADDSLRFEQDLARENAMLADVAMGKREGTPCAKCGCGGAKKLCGRCRQVSYCSQQCQKQHWKRHKKQCTPVSDRPKESDQLSGIDIAAAMAALAQTGDPTPQQPARGSDAILSAGKDAGPPVPNAFRECAELFVRCPCHPGSLSRPAHCALRVCAPSTAVQRSRACVRSAYRRRLRTRGCSRDR
eukprot:COSAG02_NODE_589_length_19902_cov_119.928939_9_plen_289_part_00